MNVANGDHALTNVCGENSASSQNDRDNHQALVPYNSKKRKHEESDDSSAVGVEPIVEIAKVNFKNFFITIFTEDVRNPKRFFFQPLVLLDPKSIISESHGFLQQDVIRLTIQMWNPEIRSKVLDRLRSLPSLSNVNVHEDDIYVLPFEEVQLVHKPGSIHQSIRLLDEPKRYHRLSESLHFYLLCDSAPAANAFSEDFRRNPEFVLENSQLALECRGLSLGYPIGNRPNFKYYITTFPNEDLTGMESLLPRLKCYDEEIKELKAKLEEKKLLTFVPVFSVSQCTNPQEYNCQCFAYSTFGHETNTEYGDFDLKEGTFTVKKAGIYQFHFSSRALLDDDDKQGSEEHIYSLDVDGVSKSTFRFRMSSVEENGCTADVNLVSLLPMAPGQKVGVYQASGGLYEVGNHTTKFSGIVLLS